MPTGRSSAACSTAPPGHLRQTLKNDRTHGGPVSEIAESTRGGVAALQAAMAQFQQIELDTGHYFADGMYCRTVAQPAGALVVGKVHLREHFFMVLRGSVAVIQDGAERRVYEAGSVIVSAPGTKRALLAIEDCLYLTVHRTDKTDLAQLEADVIEPDPSALFGPDNRLKTLEHQS